MILKNKSTILAILFTFSFSIPAYADVHYQQAISIVKNLPSSKGGTVEKYLSGKAKIPAIEDLGWHAYPRDDGYEIERLLIFNQTKPLRYKWHVNKTNGSTRPLNGKAIEITK